METMPRPRPPHLHKETTRHGATVWYARVGKGPRIRIKETFGTPEFTAAYHAAVSGEISAPRKSAAKSNSLQWLLEQYRNSADWARLSRATRRQRENIFRQVMTTAADAPFAELSRKDMAEAVDRRAKTPFAAKNFIQAMRGLYKWAVKLEYVERDPTDNVSIARPKTEGFHAWSESEIAKFEAHWPVGTRERLALALFLYTGLRRGDVATLGRQHVRDGVIALRTEKTATPVIIPVLPELQTIIDQSPTGDILFLVGKTRKKMAKESLGNWFKEACVAAGVPGSAHGLRKAGATRLANNGATVAQLEAIYGWTGGNMASLYTKTADRTRLARDAMGMLAKPKTETPIPAPIKMVRAKIEKT